MLESMPNTTRTLRREVRGHGAGSASRAKKNCWEVCGCGREPGGSHVDEFGACPAGSDTSFHGINEGINGGRFCWAVAGTFCGGEVQGSFAEKRESCTACRFFKQVRAEEGTVNLETKFLSFISRNGAHPALFRNEMYKLIPAGERFITQGEVGDTAYVIQRGSCLVLVEKGGELHPVYHYGEGDIVGGIGLLTGEPHLAHVDAETDVEAWALTKEDFDRISEEDAELRAFLTEFVANRFDSRRPTSYRTIGKYIATEIIGRGGYSIVYKGVHSTLNMPVAIKMMRHNLAMDEEFLEKFHAEARTIATLNHENIVKIYDIETRYRTVFIVMELLEAESLGDLLRRLRILPQNLVLDILLQVCAGLSYAHRRGIIHRDVTPDNIFLLPGDRVKIIDFGLACPVGTEDFDLSGTAAYISPEQIEGEAVDPRTDLYGLGLVAYEMVTGEKPFQAEDTNELLDMHLKQEIPDPAEKAPGLHEGLRAFIRRAARRNLADRYPTAEHALRDLRPVAKEIGLTGRHVAIRPQRMTNLVMVYEDQQQKALSELLDEFSGRAKALGVDVKISDLRDA